MIVSQQALNLAIQIRVMLLRRYLSKPRLCVHTCLSKHRLCVHTTLPQQATHLDIQMQPLVRHLLGQSRLPARSVLLPLAEVSAGHPHL